MILFSESQFSSFLKGQYSKITFRTPLYLGGAPSTYWLVRATGTHRGFQGCVQSLTVNGERIDLRPWPLGKALSGADVGEWCPVGWVLLWGCLFGVGQGGERLREAAGQCRTPAGGGPRLMRGSAVSLNTKTCTQRGAPSPGPPGLPPGPLQEMGRALVGRSSSRSALHPGHPVRRASQLSNVGGAPTCSLLLREVVKF